MNNDLALNLAKVAYTAYCDSTLSSEDIPALGGKGRMRNWSELEGSERQAWIYAQLSAFQYLNTRFDPILKELVRMKTE